LHALTYLQPGLSLKYLVPLAAIGGAYGEAGLELGPEKQKQEHE